MYAQLLWESLSAFCANYLRNWGRFSAFGANGYSEKVYLLLVPIITVITCGKLSAFASNDYRNYLGTVCQPLVPKVNEVPWGKFICV